MEKWSIVFEKPVKKLLLEVLRKILPLLCSIVQNLITIY